MKKQCSYFTLVEILTVIVILIILTGISLGVTSLVRNKISTARTESAIKMIEIALEQYKTKYGYYPRSSQNPIPFYLDYVDLDTSTVDANKTQNNIWQFLDEKFKNTSTRKQKENEAYSLGNSRYVIDGYDRPLIYRYPGMFNKGGFDLGSCGKDGKYGDGAGNVIQTPENISQTNYENFGQGDDIVNFKNNAK